MARECLISGQGEDSLEMREEWSGNGTRNKCGVIGSEYGRERMANLELLRCVAMMMVVVLHYLGKGGLLTELTEETLGSVGTVAWLLESFCIVAVNVYMFISGYFLCMSSFKPSRLIQLWLQVWAYSVVIGLLGALTGVMTETAFDMHYLLTLFLPITMGHYWFMTSYVFLYLLLPFVGMAAGKMTKQQMQISLGFLFFTFCILKSVLPLRLEMDEQGYNCLWYACVFLAAAYVRRFCITGSEESAGRKERLPGFSLKKRGCCLGLYVGGCLLIFAGTMLLRTVYLHTGSLGRMLGMCLEYNHLLPFLAAVGLFGVFYSLRIQGKAADVINKVAPHTLGVYLLHENLGLRYTWQNWFRAEQIVSMASTSGEGKAAFGAVVSLLLWTVIAVVCVFVCGILADIVRKWIFHMLHQGLSCLDLYSRGVFLIAKADAAFKRDCWEKDKVKRTHKND